MNLNQYCPNNLTNYYTLIAAAAAKWMFDLIEMLVRLFYVDGQEKNLNDATKWNNIEEMI